MSLLPQVKVCQWHLKVLCTNLHTTSVAKFRAASEIVIELSRYVHMKREHLILQIHTNRSQSQELRYGTYLMIISTNSRESSWLVSFKRSSKFSSQLDSLFPKSGHKLMPLLQTWLGFTCGENNSTLDLLSPWTSNSIISSIIIVQSPNEAESQSHVRADLLSLQYHKHVKKRLSPCGSKSW